MLCKVCLFVYKMLDYKLNFSLNTLFMINSKLFLILAQTYVKLLARVQMKSWAGKALETVNCYAFLKRRLIGVCWQLT
jgi:hypothetical protein